MGYRELQGFTGFTFTFVGGHIFLCTPENNLHTFYLHLYICDIHLFIHTLYTTSINLYRPYKQPILINLYSSYIHPVYTLYRTFVYLYTAYIQLITESFDNAIPAV